MVFGLFGTRKPAVTDNEQRASPTNSIHGADKPPRTPSPGAGEQILDDGNTIADPATLITRLKRIPPKTLHSFVLREIPNASHVQLAALTAFFGTLEPPPVLHCVRCHKGYVEVENDDRACKVAHDDDSAEVEHVGLGRGKGTYETIFGCCNKTVEGDGDQGPPDGWCYEGMHTTDVKRARFRADSTPNDDKLISCSRRRCFEPESARRARKSLRGKQDSGSESEDDLAHDVVRENLKDIIGVPAHAGDEDAMEGVEEETVVAEPQPKKVRGKIESMKPRSTASSAASGSALKVPGSPGKEKLAEPRKVVKKPREKKEKVSADHKKSVSTSSHPGYPQATSLPPPPATTSSADPTASVPAITADASKPKAKAKRPRKSAADKANEAVYKPAKGADGDASESESAGSDWEDGGRGAGSKRGRGRGGAGGGGGKRRKVD
ncbi:hypothetical protein BD410DRAFT_50114 [Rickenella mellea]|uniref:Uncharacterized protein n=1 Tax=Rickenella mellea TaxID=50990 RepID=A0A4R5XFT7_9AGAM|nr:hypothetical protein BD410DRAFT_50114 [Rickenella mellea]